MPPSLPDSAPTTTTPPATPRPASARDTIRRVLAEYQASAGAGAPRALDAEDYDLLTDTLVAALATEAAVSVPTILLTVAGGSVASVRATDPRTRMLILDGDVLDGGSHTFDEEEWRLLEPEVKPLTAALLATLREIEEFDQPCCLECHGEGTHALPCGACGRGSDPTMDAFCNAALPTQRVH